MYRGRPSSIKVIFFPVIFLSRNNFPAKVGSYDDFHLTIVLNMKMNLSVFRRPIMVVEWS